MSRTNSQVEHSRSGFNRLKGAVATAAVASAGLFGGASSVRAATQSHNFFDNLTVQGVGPNNHYYELEGLFNDSVSITCSTPTSCIANYTTGVSVDGSILGIAVSSVGDTSTSYGNIHNYFGAYVVGDETFDDSDSSVDFTENVITVGSQTNIQAGINANLEYRLYTDKVAVRSTIILTNTTGSNISLPVGAIGSLTNSAVLYTYSTSSGDAVLQDSDLWMTVTDNNLGDPGSRPGTILGIQGKNSRLSNAKEEFEFLTSNARKNYFFYYDVTVPANQTVRIMNFHYFGLTNAELDTASGDFESMATLRAANYVDDMTEAELTTVLNYSDPKKASKKKKSGGGGSIGFSFLASLFGLAYLRRNFFS